MIDLMKRLYTALQTFLGNVATNDSVETAIETAVGALDIPTDQEIQGMIDTSVQALDIPTDQEIEDMIDTGISASAFDVDTTENPTYVEDVTEALNASDGIKCIKYKNGWKRFIGVVTVVTALSPGDTIFTLPSGYGYDIPQNGGIQGWITCKDYAIRVCGQEVKLFSANMPTGSYALDFLYH